MKKHLNTVYVLTEDAWLHKEGQNIVMKVQQTSYARLPMHMLSSIVCFGRTLISPPLLEACMAQGITVSYLHFSGRFMARVEGPVSGNVCLRRAQYRISDDVTRSAILVRHFLFGKIHNQRYVMQRTLRDHGSKLTPQQHEYLKRDAQQLRTLTRKLLHATDLNHLRGLEGHAAKIYFGHFSDYLLHQQGKLRFYRRTRRPPLDPVNAALSFLYETFARNSDFSP